jgi:hypothetical protein
MSSDERGPSGRSIFSTVVLIAILLVLLFVGYLIVDLIQTLKAPFVPIQGAATTVHEVLNPTPTIIASPITIVKEIQALSRLETASFTVQQVITAESGTGPFGFLFQDRLLLVAEGQVIAGLDLSRIQEGDVTVVGDTVYLTVPAAEIFVATLDNDATFVYDRETAVLAGDNINLETLARQEAERKILEAAIEDGILDMAQTNGSNYLRSLLMALGFTNVQFVTATPAPDQDMGTP